MKVKSCVVCGKEHTRAYGKCCSKECSNIPRRRTCKESYGVEVSSQNPEVKRSFKKLVKSCMEDILQRLMKSKLK